MRGTDYVVKRVLFAIGTVFVAITLNFVLFARSRATRSRLFAAVGARRTSRSTSDASSDSTSRSGSSTRSISATSRTEHGPLAPHRGARHEHPVGADQEHRAHGRARTLFAIVFGVATGVIAAWRRGTATDKGALWGGLGFYSMPPQWLGLVIVLFIAGWVGLPTAGVKDPTLGILDDPGSSRCSSTGSST